MNPYHVNDVNIENLPKNFPPQHQMLQPGIESIMEPLPNIKSLIKFFILDYILI